MNIKNSIVAVVALGFVAGANLAIAQSGNGGANAAAASQPLQVYQLLSGPTSVYYKNRNRYHDLAYAGHVKIFNKFTAVSFINDATQPIRTITFQLAAYSDDYRPVVGANGQPVIKRLVATGPFAPGAKHTLVNANVVWLVPPGNGLGCVRLNGLQIDYADGTSTTVSAENIPQYLAPQLSNKCGIPPSSCPGAHTGWAGPTPFIAGVYPARWMIVGLSKADLARQPFVSPGDTQLLCAVDSFLEEACAVAANTPGSQPSL